MSAEAHEIEPDLASVDAWSYHQQDGRTDPDVIVSWCGRFTVVYLPHDGIYRAHRRYPGERRMSECIGAANAVAAAVDLCVLQAAEDGA